MTENIDRDEVVENYDVEENFLTKGSSVNTNYDPEPGTPEWDRVHPYESGILKRQEAPEPERKSVSVSVNYDGVSIVINTSFDETAEKDRRWIAELLVDDQSIGVFQSYNYIYHSSDLKKDVKSCLMDILSLTNEQAESILNELLTLTLTNNVEIRQLNPANIHPVQPVKEAPKKRGRPKKASDERPINDDGPIKSEDIPKEREVYFDEVAQAVLEKYNIMTFEDTKEIYIYENGVYTLKGSSSKLERIIRAEYNEIYEWKNEERLEKLRRLELELDDFFVHVPVPKTAYITEVMNYIKSYTSVYRDDIDKADPRLINLNNGMFDLNQWKLIPHDPKYRSIRRVPVTYDPHATCPKITQFMSQVVLENDARVLIEYMGYSLIPETRMQKAVLLFGEGSNGKSIFLKLMSKLIGNENISNVSLQALQNDKFKIANLYGMLLNIYAELPDQTMYQSDIFKTLVGGDRVEGERKYMPSFGFDNTARLVFSANKIPQVKNKEYAYFRRWILIGFPNQFKEGAGDDKDIFTKISTDEELSGLLNLALEGLKTILTNDKFSYDQSAENVEATYKLYSSSVSTFAENCLTTEDNDTTKQNMYKAYVAWAKAKNLKPEAENNFGKIFKKMGYEDSRPLYPTPTGPRKVYVWDNVKVDADKFLNETGIPLTEVWEYTW